MTWATVYEATLEVDPATDPITLTGEFQPYYRLIVTAELLTGLGVREPFLGYLRQLLIVPGLGEVKGRTLALMPLQQLFIPSTELPYKLVYQPVQKDFSLKLTIQVESTIVNSSGTADNGPVLAAIAAVQSQLETLTPSSEPINYSSLFTQVLANLSALSQDVNLLGSQFAAFALDQAAMNAALENLQSTDTQLVSMVGDILEALGEAEPNPPPTTTPTAAGVAYTASQSSLRSGNSFFQATYARLTDGDQSTGGVTDGVYGSWIMATFPYLVRVTQVTLSGGTLDGYGDSSGSQNGSALQSTTDGTNWTNLVSVSGIPNYTASGNKVVNFSLTTPVDVTAIRLFKDGEVAMPRFEFQ
ncbi:MAG: discoidin domain-containing protein [Stenomitos rutilans HA7619-LM2]|jgi:hypothetical protein|nr:discoidin domain-containing protein [Stenomitos rutilans HA7619-LM2]